MKTIVTPKNLSSDFELDTRTKKIGVNINAGDGIGVTKNSNGITLTATSGERPFRMVWQGDARKDDIIRLGENIRNKDFMVLIKLTNVDNFFRTSGIMHAFSSRVTNIIKVNSDKSTVEVKLTDDFNGIKYLWNSEESRRGPIIKEIWVR